MSAFDRIIGYENHKNELKRYCDVIRNPEKYKDLGVNIPTGILLEGAPGLGKSTMAMCFMEECGCKSYTLRKNRPNGAFVDEIRATFDEAKQNAPAIVFLDDMDKYANEDDEHKNAEEYVAVQACIDDCKGSGVMVIATVNSVYSLPDSLIRAGRFDKTITIGFPSYKDAPKILEYYLSSKKCIGNIDVEEIAMITGGFSCAQMENVINEAGIEAGYGGHELITQQDVIKACLHEFFDAAEDPGYDDEEKMRLVAIHEAGHTVVSEYYTKRSVGLVSVFGCDGDGRGVTAYSRSIDGCSFRNKEQYIVRLLGGKAATEIVLGEPDIGCNEDMQLAFGRIGELIDNLCAYGFDSYSMPTQSSYVSENKDRMVAQELTKYYQTAKKILIDNRSFLDAIVDGLMEKNTLTCHEIQEIRDKVGMTA